MILASTGNAYISGYNDIRSIFTLILLLRSRDVPQIMIKGIALKKYKMNKLFSWG